ncbi:MAG: J domain-containing protein [Actinomycetota bacterium]
MPRSKNHYEILGVDHNADLTVIKKEYLKKARLLHPDNHPELTRSELEKREQEMKDLNAAWSTISNHEKRKKYDASLDMRISSDELRQTSRRISEELLAEEESKQIRITRVASLEEMEIRGFAKLMKPIPLLILLVLLTGTIVIGFIIGGNTSSTNPKVQYVPGTVSGEPKLCIDIAPVEEVPCDGREDASVWEIIGANEKCSSGLIYEYRSQIGGGYCVTYSRQSLP